MPSRLVLVGCVSGPWGWRDRAVSRNEARAERFLAFVAGAAGAERRTDRLWEQARGLKTDALAIVPGLTAYVSTSRSVRVDSRYFRGGLSKVDGVALLGVGSNPWWA